MSVQLKVFFEDSFWIGLFSIDGSSGVKVCRVVFGKEPPDVEVYQYIKRNFFKLVFVDAQSSSVQKSVCDNPKRRQRQISRELRDSIGLKKSYEAIKQSISQASKKENCLERKQEKERHSEYVFELKRIKRREKHRGH